MTNQKRTEERGINAIKQYFDECDAVDTSYIAINDKAPALDGTIDIYSDTHGEQFSKKNLKFNLPVQIKSTTNDIIKNRFRISLTDLKFYDEHTNGLIYLVVSTATNPRKIFYKKLAPLDIKEILLRSKPSTAKDPTTGINLKIVPKDPLAFLNILEDFHYQQEHQPKSLLDIADMKNSNPSLITKVTSKPQYLAETLKSGVYFYRKLIDEFSGKEILIPYHSASLSDLFEVGQTSISNSSGETIPATISVSKITDEHILKFGYGDSITIQSGKTVEEREKELIKVHFTPHGSYNIRLHDVKFLKELLNHPNSSQAQDIRWKNFISYLNEQEKKLSYIISDLNTLSISTDLNPNKISSEGLKELDSLQRILHDNLIVDPEDQHITIVLDAYRYNFFIHKNRIINHLTPQFTKYYTIYFEQSDGSKLPVNPYTGIREHLSEYPNFSINLILKGFENMDCTSDDAVNYYNYYALDLLSEFDRTNFAPLLDLAIKIFNKIQPSLTKSTFIINQAQTELRKNKKLNLSQIKNLLPLSTDKNRLIRLSALVLLNQPDNAQELWETLSNKDQKQFESWPIFKLFNISK